MLKSNKLLTKIFLLTIVSLFVLSFSSSQSFGQNQKRIVVTGQVIGVEVPESGWAMEYEMVKIFYLRIEKVLKGKTVSNYIRIAYGYNPSSAPERILPQDLFSGKNIWKFKLSRWDMFDAKVGVSKSEGDWVVKNKETIKGADFLPENDPRKDDEFTSFTIIRKCVPLIGYEKEAVILETLDIVKGYWLLDFEKKRLLIK
jgi:hypothetical protein